MGGCNTPEENACDLMREDEERAKEVMRDLYGLLNDRGLLSGSMQTYWYRIYDMLVYELCPSLAEEE